MWRYQTSSGSQLIANANDLKRQYASVRSSFRQVHERWSRPGQNDPTNFPKFWETIESTGSLSALCRNFVLLFTVRNMVRKVKLQICWTLLYGRFQYELWQIVEKHAIQRNCTASEKSKLTIVKDESKTELLKKLSLLLQMRRELGNEETE